MNLQCVTVSVKCSQKLKESLLEVQGVPVQLLYALLSELK